MRVGWEARGAQARCLRGTTCSLATTGWPQPRCPLPPPPASSASPTADGHRADALDGASRHWPRRILRHRDLWLLCAAAQRCAHATAGLFAGVGALVACWHHSTLKRSHSHPCAQCSDPPVGRRRANDGGGAVRGELSSVLPQGRGGCEGMENSRAGPQPVRSRVTMPARPHPPPVAHRLCAATWPALLLSCRLRQREVRAAAAAAGRDACYRAVQGWPPPGGMVRLLHPDARQGAPLLLLLECRAEVSYVVNLVFHTPGMFTPAIKSSQVRDVRAKRCGRVGGPTAADISVPRAGGG